MAFTVQQAVGNINLTGNPVVRSQALVNGTSGTRRGLLVFFTESDVGTTAATYNGTSPLFAEEITNRLGVYYWDDSRLPADTSAHDISINFGGSRSGTMLIFEVSDVEQQAVGDIVRAKGFGLAVDPMTLDITPTYDAAIIFLLYARVENRNLTSEPSGTQHFSTNTGTGHDGQRITQVVGPTPAALTTYTWDTNGTANVKVFAIQFIEDTGAAGPISGDGAGTLGALGADGDGTVEVEGVGAGTLSAMSGAGAGTVLVEGAGASTLTAMTGAGVATVRIAGAGAATLASLSAAGAGSVSVTGVGSATLAALAADGEGTVLTPISGSGAGLLAAIFGTGAGTVATPAAVVVRYITGELSLRPIVTGRSSMRPAVTARRVSMRPVVTGTVGQGPAVAIAPSVPLEGQGAGVLAALLGGGAGRVRVSGIGAGALAALIADGEGTVAAGGPAAPDSIAGLFVWHRASDLALSDGAAISTWTDESGNGRHLTAGAVTPTFKTDIVNGHAVARFDGAGSVVGYADNTLDSLTAAEVFVVLKLDTDPPGAITQSGLWALDNSASAIHYPFTDGVVYDGFGSTARHTTGDPTDSLAAWHSYNVASASGAWTSRVNGVQHFTTATNTVGWRTTGLNVGANLNNNYFDGDMAELFIYDHVLSSDDRSAVHAYLNARYGFSLP